MSVLCCEWFPSPHAPVLLIRSVAGRQMDVQPGEIRRGRMRAKKIKIRCRIKAVWTSEVSSPNQQNCAQGTFLAILTSSKKHSPTDCGEADARSRNGEFAARLRKVPGSGERGDGTGRLADVLCRSSVALLTYAAYQAAIARLPNYLLRRLSGARREPHRMRRRGIGGR